MLAVLSYFRLRGRQARLPSAAHETNPDPQPNSPREPTAFPVAHTPDLSERQRAGQPAVRHDMGSTSQHRKCRGIVVAMSQAGAGDGALAAARSLAPLPPRTVTVP